MFCRFLTNEVIKRGKTTEEEIARLGDFVVFSIINIVVLFFAFYVLSPFIASLALLWFWGANFVTAPLVILAFAVSFENARDFIQKIKDAFNASTEN